MKFGSCAVSVRMLRTAYQWGWLVRNAHRVPVIFTGMHCTRHHWPQPQCTFASALAPLASVVRISHCVPVSSLALYSHCVPVNFKVIFTGTQCALHTSHPHFAYQSSPGFWLWFGGVEGVSLLLGEQSKFCMGFAKLCWGTRGTNNFGGALLE